MDRKKKYNQKHEVVYLPSNEPYLGRELLFHFDQVILSCLEANKDIATYTHNAELSELQKAACQIIPQGINLALTIRELVRQGYLFGALVLIRPLIERAAIISYIHTYPDEINTWKNGWPQRKKGIRNAPPLSKMLKTMSGMTDFEEAKKVCEMFGHIVHGDPMGSSWNLVKLSEGGMGYSVGKVINEPELCDFICVQSYLYLIVLIGMMVECFPDAPSMKSDKIRGLLNYNNRQN